MQTQFSCENPIRSYSRSYILFSTNVIELTSIQLAIEILQVVGWNNDKAATDVKKWTIESQQKKTSYNKKRF